MYICDMENIINLGRTTYYIGVGFIYECINMNLCTCCNHDGIISHDDEMSLMISDESFRNKRIVSKDYIIESMFCETDDELYKMFIESLRYKLDINNLRSFLEEMPFYLDDYGYLQRKDGECIYIDNHIFK